MTLTLGEKGIVVNMEMIRKYMLAALLNCNSRDFGAQEATEYLNCETVLTSMSLPCWCWEHSELSVLECRTSPNTCHPAGLTLWLFSYTLMLKIDILEENSIYYYYIFYRERYKNFTLSSLLNE